MKQQQWTGMDGASEDTPHIVAEIGYMGLEPIAELVSLMFCIHSQPFLA